MPRDRSNEPAGSGTPGWLQCGHIRLVALTSCRASKKSDAGVPGEEVLERCRPRSEEQRQSQRLLELGAV